MKFRLRYAWTDIVLIPLMAVALSPLLYNLAKIIYEYVMDISH